MGTSSCAHKNVPKQTQLVQPKFDASPAVVIYKTKKDYSRFVAVTLSADKSKITSYPAPSDISPEMSVPVALADGYWLDRRGIGEHVAFLKMTYAAYAQLSSPPSKEQLWSQIQDKDPIVSMYNCGAAYSYTDKEKQINEVIKSGKVKTLFKQIK
ncbi:hypothetical protein [Edaphocola aurantiacus]|uniref:hypothetical protein n=1 Tax=Edaphocola aurantiacus TaxID=2601682 RepID=UPI001C962347|nr:hypothetical protein [Edaphocola aurantiacus]